MNTSFLKETAANIEHTIQDCYKKISNTKIEQLAGLVLDTKGTEFYEKAIAIHQLALVSPSTYIMEIDCLMAEYPF